MAYKSRVSDAVVRRLPMYYRHLRELEKAGVVRISSQELGERMNLTASQIRQDINCFGGFGQQGYGYHVANLKERIGEILGLNHEYHVIIIGAGNIGRAVARESVRCNAARVNFSQDITIEGRTSVFGRAAYDYDNRYYAEFSFRYDGSSKFRSD